MHDSAAYRIALAAILLGAVIVRVRYHAPIVGRSREPGESHENRMQFAIRLVVALILFEALFTWILTPGWMAWAAIELPSALRWFGVAIGALAVVALALAHRALGSNFSGTMRMAANQQLVTIGPYRIMRHPMYAAMYALAIAFFLISANWFIGAGFIIALTAALIGRVPREEAVMAARFGDQYREWASRTPRFIPRIRG